jgi:radical SAM superfamily enzyme YgiQ (UPF0313 family)
MVKDLAAAGCKGIHIGVESGDDKVLRSIAKNINLDQVRASVIWMAKYGIYVETSFIVGLPKDTKESMEKTLLFALAIRAMGYTAALAISTPYPGTPLYEHSKQLGLRMLTNDWQMYNLNTPIYDTANFAAWDVTRALYLFNKTVFSVEPSVMLTAEPHTEYRRDLFRWMETVKTAADGYTPQLAHSVSE